MFDKIRSEASAKVEGVVEVKDESVEIMNKPIETNDASSGSNDASIEIIDEIRNGEVTARKETVKYKKISKVQPNETSPWSSFPRFEEESSGLLGSFSDASFESRETLLDASGLRNETEHQAVSSKYPWSNRNVGNMEIPRKDFCVSFYLFVNHLLLQIWNFCSDNAAFIAFLFGILTIATVLAIFQELTMNIAIILLSICCSATLVFVIFYCVKCMSNPSMESERARLVTNVRYVARQYEPRRICSSCGLY